MKKISMILLGVLISAIFLSCSDSNSGAVETTAVNTNVNEEAVTEETTEARIDPGLPDDKYYDGYEFTVLTKGTTSTHWYSRDIAATEVTGEPINDAVYNRNLVISEKYGVTIVDIPGSTNDPAPLESTARKAIAAGDDVYDMLCFRTPSLIADGYLYNIYDIPYINLDQPYYDQNIIEAHTIQNRLYCLAGDMVIMDNDAIINVQFNKKIAEDYGFAEQYGKNLYGMVNDGEWTLSVFYETAKMVTEDLNGDGQMTELTDRWGYQTEAHNGYAFFAGGGEKIAQVENDYPVIKLESERAVSVLEKVVEIQMDRVHGLHSDVPKGYADVWTECMDKNFEGGLALYNIAGLNRVTLFRAMEIDFGLLPMPKYDENQERYYNPVNTWCGNFICIPMTVSDVERTGIIIEALSCESRYTLLPAYYDITLKTKLSRDEESSAMVDLLLETTMYDIGMFYNWGGAEGILTGLQDAGKYSSSVASKMTSINAAIDKTMDALLSFE